MRNFLPVMELVTKLYLPIKNWTSYDKKLSASNRQIVEL